jgi:hypothetical protein
MSIDLTQSAIELDQEDLFARYQYAFPDVPALLQRRGVIESDVETKLESLNSKNQKVGACIIVLMPKLLPEQRDSPGPRYFARYPVQVIVWPPAALGATGAGYSAESLVETIIGVTHYFAFGRGDTLVFDGCEPAEVKPGRVSYLVYFRRLGVVEVLAKSPLVGIAGVPVAGGIEVTLTVAAGHEAWYTTDGSYPSPIAPTASRYAAPFLLPTACTLRVATNSGATQQSNIAQADITPVTS